MDHWTFEEGVGDMVHVHTQVFLFTFSCTSKFFSQDMCTAVVCMIFFPLCNMLFIGSLNDCEFFLPVVVRMNVFFLVQVCLQLFFYKITYPSQYSSGPPHSESPRRVLLGI